MDFVLGRLMTIATFLVLLAILIFFHELGHFLAAKLFRMRVEEFALGFGKRLVRVGFDGETEYNVRAIPLGGFVRIAGMEVEEMMERRLSTAGDEKPSTRPPETTNVGLLEQEVAEVSGADPNGFNSRPVYQRFLVILAGPAFSIALAWLVFCLVGAIYGIPDTSATRVGVLPGGLAAQAGLRSGDAILAVDGAPVDGESLPRIIRSAPGKPLRLTVRTGELPERTVLVTPRPETENGKVVGRIGIKIGGYPPTLKRVPVAEAFRLDNWYMRRSLEDLGALFRKGIDRDSLSGPVGIVQITDRVRQAGLPSLLLLLGGVSFSIGLFNLLPIPILDGGHLTLLTLEGIRGRKLTAEQMWRVQLTGLAIILTLFVLVTFNDISRFFRP
jgi:regulator of sigma E protease